MDRLVCGDVGFGKTEVALRAAAAVALSGRRVALAAPTTVLARQHVETFKRRFSGSGIGVAHLSRLVTPAEAQDVKQGLESGEVRIVIGTQALGGKDLVLDNLGLMITRRRGSSSTDEWVCDQDWAAVDARRALKRRARPSSGAPPNPHLSQSARQALIDQLMSARRAGRETRKTAEPERFARAQVLAAKVGLGARGPVWWTDGAPDLNRPRPGPRPMPIGGPR